MRRECASGLQRALQRKLPRFVLAHLGPTGGWPIRDPTDPRRLDDGAVELGERSQQRRPVVTTAIAHRPLRKEQLIELEAACHSDGSG